MRLFIAIETPPEIRDRIFALLAPLQNRNTPVKWERNEKLHVTLKFIGEIPDDEVPAITAALRTAATSIQGPFPVSYTDAGMFPNRKSPKTIWIGMDNPGGMMTRLHEMIEQTLEPFGIEREQRAFHPHVTVGRIKGERIPALLLEELEKLTLHTDQMPVSEFVLMKSELKADGSAYSVLERFTIGTRPDQPEMSLDP